MKNRIRRIPSIVPRSPGILWTENFEKSVFNKILSIADKDVRSRIITRDGNTPAPQVEVKGRIIFDYTTEEKLAEEVQRILGNF